VLHAWPAKRKRQVEGARIALASTSGGFMNVEDGIAAITLLGKA
jgi:hypothetical protein